MAVLEISPSTYYAAKKREEYPSARDERDGAEEGNLAGKGKKRAEALRC